MLRIGLIFICLISPLMAQARTVPDAEIRQIQTDSTDVFEVLAMLKRAQSAFEKRNYGSARQGFESVLMFDPNLISARTGLRRTLIAIGDIEAAQHFMTDMNSPDSLIIRIRSGEVENPQDLLKTTLKSNPDPRLWTLLGQLHDRRREFPSARQSYAMAGLAGARVGLAENNIGQSHWLAGEFELARDAFSKAAALDPADIQFDNNRRRALIRLGQTQNAISGLKAERAGLFLAKAADKAVTDNEINLARFLYRKSLDIAPRHNPYTAEKLARLEQ